MEKLGIEVTPAEVGEFVYKYRSVDVYSLRLLLTGEIYFASPVDLNDPFDCAVRIMWEDASEDYLRQAMAESARSDLERVLAILEDRPDIQQVVPDWEGRSDEIEKEILDFRAAPELYADQLQKEWEKSLANSMSVFSLSRDPAHPLMWSHYASGHTGFCVGLDYERMFNWMKSLSGREEFDEIRPFRVRYVEDMEELSPHILTEGAILARSIVVKHRDWEYEAETRLIALRRPKHPRLLPEGIIKRVIFGAKMPPDVRDSIMQMFRGRSVDLYEATRVRGSYELEIQPIAVDGAE